MAEHVDILKTGSAQPLARVVFDDGHVRIVAHDAEYWHELLQQIVQIDADEHPESFFHALPDKVDGSYVYATPPHHEGDDDCPAPDATWSERQPAHA